MEGYAPTKCTSCGSNQAKPIPWCPPLGYEPGLKKMRCLDCKQIFYMAPLLDLVRVTKADIKKLGRV